MTPFRPGDLIVPRKTEYRENPAIFLGLSWEHHPRCVIEPITGSPGMEDGWVVYPWVMSSGPCGRVWGTDWHYIENCELVCAYNKPTEPSRRWERLDFKFFIPPAKRSIWSRVKTLFRRK